MSAESAADVLEMGGVVYTFRDGAAVWRQMWRRRRARRGLPGARLDFYQWSLRQQQRQQA